MITLLLIITLVEVLDTAIKVGLGALIGGVSTYWVTKLNHDKELEKENIKRRKRILEDIAAHCDRFAHQSQNYWALIADWVEAENPDVDRSNAKSRKIEKSSQLLYEAFHELTSAEGKLLLLGEVDTHTKLREYGAYSQEFYTKAHINNHSLTLEKLVEYKNNMRDKRKALLLTLSECYKRKDA